MEIYRKANDSVAPGWLLGEYSHVKEAGKAIDCLCSLCCAGYRRGIVGANAPVNAPTEQLEDLTFKL